MSGGALLAQMTLKHCSTRSDIVGVVGCDCGSVLCVCV